MLGIVGIVVLVLAVVLVTLGVWIVRRPLPVLSGTIEVSGTSASIEVVRDDRGVPQIYADSVADLFYGLGYVHSQDRFWEMDFRRHLVSGTLSEMFGDSSLDVDKVTRTMGWRRVAEQEYRMLSAQSRLILKSYAAGVNEYLATHSESELSVEYSILGLSNGDYEVRPWEPVDSVAWLKALAWDLRGNMEEEIQRAVAAQEVGVRRTQQLFPEYPYARNRPILDQGAVVAGSWDPAAGSPPAATAASWQADSALAPLLATNAAFRAVDGVLGRQGEGIGSNSWVVDGSKTDTGQPLLANDPHLAPGMPSLWYQAGLHCRTVSPRCQYDVAGWTNAGVPGVLIGHNADIAWGFTNLGPDVTDLLLHKVTGEKYLYDGQKKKIATREEVINVAGSDPVTITVRTIRGAPIMSDVMESTEQVGKDAPVPAPGQDSLTSPSPSTAVTTPLAPSAAPSVTAPTTPSLTAPVSPSTAASASPASFTPVRASASGSAAASPAASPTSAASGPASGAPPATDPSAGPPTTPNASSPGPTGSPTAEAVEKVPVIPPRGNGYAVALRWTALTPRPTFDAFDILNTAADWNEFRQAAAVFAVPSQNLVFADRKGNIGYQAPGVIPIRKGYDGKWPVPGWTSEYKWDGYIPFGALPWVKNPDRGYIVTANQAVTYPDYQYFLTGDWSYGSRSQRIVDLLEQQMSDGSPITVQDMQQIQMDARNDIASFLLPRIEGYTIDDDAQDALALFDGWDYQQPKDSAAGAYFNAFWRQMVERVFNDELDSTETYANAGDRYWQVIRSLWKKPNSKWWNDVDTPEKENRDATVVASLNAASTELDQTLGEDPSSWRWGALHQLTLENATLGRSGVGLVEKLLNRGPFDVGGGSSIVQATGWEPQDGYEVTWVPSMRQVVDLADLDRSTWVNLAGQSGHTMDPLYDDQTEAWINGEQYPWPFTRQAVEDSERNTLVLEPAG